ncbi:hypothetical protein AZE42_08090 [Rhizopogon vesiculosus]|uniref:Uncharacterized protein n=1 Tax=Rhizopogon vesiculosus TaxID=180088 RepID=A0A1J8QSP2_9AGAM|nr:hypothetical protein AZE42_08090 [Rhizopogon vesiculosus]
MLPVHVEPVDVSSEQLIAYAYARILLKAPGGIPSAYDYPEDEFQRDYVFFIHPVRWACWRRRVRMVLSLSLRQQLGKAKGINDVMWKTVGQKIVAQEEQEVVAERWKGTAPLASTREPMYEDDVEMPRKQREKTEGNK